MHAWVLFQELERFHVPFNQIDHMNVVADAGAVGRRVVVGEDIQVRAPSYGDLTDEGDEIVWRTIGILANFAAGVCPDGVEVAQQ